MPPAGSVRKPDDDAGGQAQQPGRAPRTTRRTAPRCPRWPPASGGPNRKKPRFGYACPLGASGPAGSARPGTARSPTPAAYGRAVVRARAVAPAAGSGRARPSADARASGPRCAGGHVGAGQQVDVGLFVRRGDRVPQPRRQPLGPHQRAAGLVVGHPYAVDLLAASAPRAAAARSGRRRVISLPDVAGRIAGSPARRAAPGRRCGTSRRPARSPRRSRTARSRIRTSVLASLPRVHAYVEQASARVQRPAGEPDQRVLVERVELRRLDVPAGVHRRGADLLGDRRAEQAASATSSGEPGRGAGGRVQPEAQARAGGSSPARPVAGAGGRCSPGRRRPVPRTPTRARSRARRSGRPARARRRTAAPAAGSPAASGVPHGHLGRGEPGQPGRDHRHQLRCPAAAPPGSSR